MLVRMRSQSFVALLAMIGVSCAERNVARPNAQTASTSAHLEDFSALALEAPPWTLDVHPEDGPFGDEGEYFTNRGIHAPAAYRASVAFGKDGWLTAEASSRSKDRPFARLLSIVTDPAGGPNRVLRLASVDHTDAIVVRPTRPLPEKYRVSLRVGFASFGDGRPGKNGYDGGETAEPWGPEDATSQNGFYWLAILDTKPGPHNSNWIHHHRKVVIDSDNHFPPWMEIWDGHAFIPSGEHPVMMFMLDGHGVDNERIGPPFLSYSANAWQPSGEIRAADSYLPNHWYEVAIARDGTMRTMTVSGDFRYGGHRTYTATMDAKAQGVFHDEGFADWFMFGDPHTNYYEGEVFYDDVRLELPK